MKQLRRHAVPLLQKQKSLRRVNLAGRVRIALTAVSAAYQL